MTASKSAKAVTGQEIKLADIDWDDYAPNGAPGEGGAILGRFQRLTRSTLGFTFPGQSGEVFPLIVIFTAVEGTTTDLRSGETSDLVPGQEYSLWLIHAIPEEAFKSAKPTQNELFGLFYHGKTQSRKQNGRDGEPLEYHNYSVSFPERAKVDQSLSWDEV